MKRRGVLGEERDVIARVAKREEGLECEVCMERGKAYTNPPSPSTHVWPIPNLSKNLPTTHPPPSPPPSFLIFRSDRSISAVIDGYCSKPISINSGVPQGSVLSPTLFLLFTNDLLSITECPIHSYADDSTLHCSITFKSRPSQIELHQGTMLQNA